MSLPAQAHRLDRLSPYVFAIIGEQIRKMQLAGTHVYRLDVGSPDLPPPEFVVETLAKSAADGKKHGYSGYRGTAAFRQSVANYYQRRFGVTLDSETEVLPLIGSKEGIVNLALAYLDSGDTALIPDISYPSYAGGTQLSGADIHWMPLTPENGFLLEYDGIPADVLSRSKILWVNYPNNPTGASADLEFYQRTVAFCQAHNLLLASDNPYVDITFDGYVAPSVLQIDGAKEQTIEFMSLSKTYNMAGWRLGAAVGSKEALKILLNVKSNIDSGHFHAIYEAGSAALDRTTQDWIDERNAVYQRRRDWILETLPHIGLSAQKTAATLYIWARVNDMEPVKYIEQALQEAHVSIAPGAAYGPGGENYVRISNSVPDDQLQAALERLKSWYAKDKG